MIPKRPNRTNEASTAGSDQTRSEPDFLVVGQIIKPHGIQGEVSVKVLTDFAERFDTMETIYLGDEHSAREYVVESTRWHKTQVLVAFEAIPDRTAAETLRGLYLKIPTHQAMPLEPDTYYHYQLEGLAVVTDTGQELGRINEILETGANDVYVVQGDQGEILIPASQEVVLSVDLDAGQITVHLIDGLI